MEPGQNTNGGMMGAGNPGFSGIAPRGGISSGSQTFPQNGEIVLASGPEKKGGAKKWIIIAFLVLFLAAAGVVVWMWATSRGGSSSGSDNGSVLDKYANYVINGDENNSNIGDEYVSNRSYYVAEQVYNSDIAGFNSFYTNANNLADEALNVYMDENVDIAGLLTGQMDMLKMFFVYKNYDELMTLDYYLNNDYSVLQKNLEAVTSSLMRSGNDYVRIYAEDILKLAELIKQKIEIFYKANCSGKSIEELAKCNIPSEYIKEYEEKGSAISTMRGEMHSIIVSAVPFYVRSVYEIL